MKVFHGIAVSPGIVSGPVYVIEQGQVNIPKYWLHDREIDDEVTRYAESLELAKNQIQVLKDKVSGLKSREHLLIIEGHLAMLGDPLITQETPRVIQNEKINAEWALTKTHRKIKDSFSKIDEEYFLERQADIEQVIERVHKNLLGKSEDYFRKIDHPVILVSHDLSPVDLAHMPREKVKGFVTDVGGRTSHTGIVAASMEIPAIVGAENISSHIQTGDTVIIDGIHGVIISNPNEETQKDYLKRQEDYLNAEKTLIAERDLPAETEDHRSIKLAANMELVEEIPFIKSQGATGIGLYRTEFLFLNAHHLPTEEEQYETYRKIIEDFSPHPVTMRTYDLGGEKDLPHARTEPEANPALGLRAIRYCLQEPEIFRTQLRAMLRASAHGSLRIMFPLISSYTELVLALDLTQSLKEDLKKEGLAFNEAIQFGIMIETPAAALIADRLATLVDFFSVGTNDLIQYVLAVDRVNEQVAYLYNPMHPAIIRILKMITESARAQKIPVHLCGEMASDPLFLPILIALGFDELSMNAVVLPRVKHVLRALKFETCQKLFQSVLECPTAEEGLGLLQQEMAKRFPEYFEYEDQN